MSRKSPAGKTGPPPFEAGPQGSSAFLLQEPCRFFKTLRSAAFGEKNRGTAPVFPRKTGNGSALPRRGGTALRQKTQTPVACPPPTQKKMPRPGSPRNRGTEVRTERKNSARHEKRFPRRSFGAPKAGACALPAGLPGGPHSPSPAGISAERSLRGAAFPRTAAPLLRASPVSAPPEFPSYRPARHSFSGGTGRAEIAAHPPRPCRTFLRDSLSHPRETPRPAPSPALSRSLRSARVGDTSCPR